MTLTIGIDVGSTYTKAVMLHEGREVVAQAMLPTGFKLAEVADKVYDQVLASANRNPGDIEYVVATGMGRHQVGSADLKITDLTAAARGTNLLFPGTRTVLDVGGQTMKASRICDRAKVRSYRLNDKCAAGTGAFLEKTARYMGFSTGEIGPLVETSKDAAPISGVCAVFAESEVINHLSQGVAPADIMHGAIVSLVGRSVQLMRRLKLEPEFTLIGGIMRYRRMAEVIRSSIDADVNVPAGELVQFASALGAAHLGFRRLGQLASGVASGVACP